MHHIQHETPSKRLLRCLEPEEEFENDLDYTKDSDIESVLKMKTEDIDAYLKDHNIDHQSHIKRVEQILGNKYIPSSDKIEIANPTNTESLPSKVKNESNSHRYWIAASIVIGFSLLSANIFLQLRQYRSYNDERNALHTAIKSLAFQTRLSDGNKLFQSKLCGEQEDRLNQSASLSSTWFHTSEFDKTNKNSHGIP